MLVDYLYNQLRPPKDPILVMAILVRDEADIIAANILFHLKQGVDAFIIGDNASTDGTRAILDDLARRHPIHILDLPDGEYHQARWMTRMARLALQKFKAQWVLNNDADEFWFAASGHLKTELKTNIPVLRVPRANMLVTPAEVPYHRSQWRVEAPILYARDNQAELSKMSLPLVSIAPKVVVNPRGLIKVKGGNHTAQHLFQLTRPKMANDIFIYHFPIRSYAKFLASAQHRAHLLRTNPATRMGNHHRRWVKMLQAGTLQQEYEGFLYNATELEVLQKFGIIVKDTRFAERFRQLQRRAQHNDGAKERV